MTKYARGLAIAGLVLFCFVFAKTSMAATLAGQPVRGGSTVEIKFPVAKYFQDLVAQAGNPRVETDRAVLAFPAGFDRRTPGRSLSSPPRAILAASV